MLSVLLSPLQKIGLYAVLVALVFGAGYYKGFRNERDRFVAFKTELEAKAKAQDMLNKAAEQKNKLIAENVKNEYEARLAALRNYYVGLRHTDTNKMPSLPIATHRVNETTTDPIFIGQCAETTLQLISLQNFVKLVQSDGN
jgi:hypothetical protein